MTGVQNLTATSKRMKLLVTGYLLRKPLFNRRAVNFEFGMDNVLLYLSFPPKHFLFQFHLIFVRSVPSGRMELYRSEAKFRQERFQFTMSLKNQGSIYKYQQRK